MNCLRLPCGRCPAAANTRQHGASLLGPASEGSLRVRCCLCLPVETEAGRRTDLTQSPAAAAVATRGEGDGQRVPDGQRVGAMAMEMAAVTGWQRRPDGEGEEAAGGRGWGLRRPALFGRRSSAEPACAAACLACRPGPPTEIHWPSPSWKTTTRMSLCWGLCCPPRLGREEERERTGAGPILRPTHWAAARSGGRSPAGSPPARECGPSATRSSPHSPEDRTPF